MIGAAVRQRTGGAAVFEQILATGRLRADIRLFLEIRLYAGLGLWQQIAGNARLLRAAADLVLPPAGAVDLVEALFRFHAEPWGRGQSGDAAGALAAFRDAAVQQFERLFTTHQGMSGRGLLRLSWSTPCFGRNQISENSKISL